MLILGCDTSSIASGALIRVDQAAATGLPYTGPVELLGSFHTEDTRSHAEVMAPGLRDLLGAAGIRGEDLDLIITGVGPGPFTGLRAGIMTARTMGWAWGVPVRGAVSLDAVAEQAYDDARAAGLPEFAVATDARRREVYAARYRLTPEGAGYTRTQGPAVGPAAELTTLLSPPGEARAEPAQGPAVAGVGARLYPEALRALPGHAEDQPRAEHLIRAALRAGLGSLSAQTSPLYLRESDARVPAGRKKALS